MVIPDTGLGFEMVKTKKQIREEDSAINAIYRREANNKMFAEERTIGVLILEGKDFYNYFELGMQTAEVQMMNRAELSLLIKHCPKSKMRDADSVAIHGKYENNVFIGRPKNHWYKEFK